MFPMKVVPVFWWYACSSTCPSCPAFSACSVKFSSWSANNGDTLRSHKTWNGIKILSNSWDTFSATFPLLDKSGNLATALSKVMCLAGWAVGGSCPKRPIFTGRKSKTPANVQYVNYFMKLSPLFSSQKKTSYLLHSLINFPLYERDDSPIPLSMKQKYVGTNA